MKTIDELNTEASAILKGLKDGTLDRKVAAEMNNIVGKLASARKGQLEYFALRGERPSIEFWQGDATGERDTPTLPKPATTAVTKPPSKRQAAR